MSAIEREQSVSPKTNAWKRITRYLWVVGACLAVVIAWSLGFDKLRDAVSLLEARLLLPIALVELASQWVRALKWRLVLGPGSRAVGLFYMSRCAGYWMPMRMGEFSPLLFKEHRTPKMGAWIVVDRVLEVATTLLLGAVGVVALQIKVGGTVAVIGVAAVCFVVAPFFILTRRDLFLWVATRTRDGSLIHRMALFFAEIRDEILALRGRIVFAGALTLVAGSLEVWGGMLLYAAFGYDLPFALSATVKCAHALTAAIPITPNATGAPFVTAGLVLNTFGGVTPEVVFAATTVGVALLNIVFWTSAAVGLLDLKRRQK